jgi:hypothetical protein
VISFPLLHNTHQGDAARGTCVDLYLLPVAPVWAELQQIVNSRPEDHYDRRHATYLLWLIS